MYGLWLYKELKTEYGHCKVEVFRKGYTASAVEIGGFVSNSLNLALENLSSITDPIGKSVCSFEIYDTEQIEYDDLFSPDATAFKVVVSIKVDGGEYVTRWSGYVTPDFFAENLSYRTPISISARDNIGYLNDVDFDLEASTITVRELIQAAFKRIAEDYPMQLVFATQKQTAEGVLAIDATISTMLFKEGTWYEAIETVLHDLAMQLRWVDNNTIAVLDLSQIPEYYSTQGFNFTNASGYREILPAWRELSQQQDYGVVENFFDGWLSEANITFVKDEVITDPIGREFAIKYYSPNNWQTSGNTYTIKPSNYFEIARIDGFTLQTLSGTYRTLPTSGFGERVFFTGTKKEDTNFGNFMSYRMPIYASSSPLKISFSALNTVLIPDGIDTLHIYNPEDLKIFADSAVGVLQLGLKMNILLHVGTNTYILKENWELLTSQETDALTFVLDQVGGKEPYYQAVEYDKEQDISIDIHSIPANGEIELRIYGFFINDSKLINTEDDKWLRYISYINNVRYSFDIQGETGKSSNVGISELHNIKTAYDYKIGQVISSHGGINAFAGGLYDANNGMNPMQGFRRNADGNVYHLTELIGREITHFNKKNYNKLSGTIKNLNKEPLMFNRLFAYNGKNYAPFAYSLNVISNEMNITTMQEVEPYITHSFVEIKSELVTGGGATVSGGNNTALQYSAEVGNAKRISELNNASESEKKESYIIIDNASWNESKKVPLSEMEGLNETELTEFLTANEYATQPWVSGIAKGLADDIANRVLIADFEKLEGTVNGNYQSINILNGKVGTLEGYFTKGVANDSAKLGGQLPSYYATASALGATNDNVTSLVTRVGNAEGVITSIQNTYVDKASDQTITSVKTFQNGLKIGDVKLEWDSTNQALKIIGNAYVTELFSVGKISESGTGGGTASAAVRIMLGETPYDAVNGVVSLPDLLPKSGGTIEVSNVGNFNIYNNSQDLSTIHFYALKNGSKTDVGYLGITANYEPIYMTSGGARNTLIHSGNIGSQSVSYASSAGTLELKQSQNPDDVLQGRLFSTPYNSSLPTGATNYLSGITFASDNNSDYRLQLALDYYGKVFSRSQRSGTWYGWKELAFTDSNVASAQALKHSNGNGAAYVGSDGYLYALGGIIDMQYSDEINRYGGTLYIQHRGDGSGNGSGGTTTGNLALCARGGNVLIGQASDDGFKLLVNGNVKVNGPIFNYYYGTNSNAAAYMFDKPGSHYTGIGSDGSTDTIRFGACDGVGGWIDYSQKWKFYGDIIANNLSISSGTISGDLVIEYALYGNNMHFRNNPNVDMILSPMSWQNYDLGWYNGSAWNTLIHSGNYSSYALPLSGGTITGPLKLTNSLELAYSSTALSVITPYGQSWFGMMNDSFCHIYTNAPAFYMDKPLYVDNGKAVVHSGNIGSQSVNYASSAGYSNNASYLITVYNENINYSAYSSHLKMINCIDGEWYSKGFPTAYTSGISVMSGYVGWQMVSYGGGEENPYFRSIQDNSNWKPWRQLAFLTDNVASATKLQTARSIWGQSFDGTGDVDGKIYQNGKWILGCHTDGNLYIGFDTYSTNDTLIYGRNLYFGTYSGHSMLINSSGNVLIGTTTDAGYRFAVNGGVLANTVRTEELRLGEANPDGSVTQNKWYYATIGYVYEDASPNTLKPAIVFRSMYDTYSEGSGNELMRIRANGTVLIGATSTYGYEGKLLVNGNINLMNNGGITNAVSISQYNSGIGYYVGSRNDGLGVTDGGALIYAYGSTPISFYTYGSERMRIGGDGNITIYKNLWSEGTIAMAKLASSSDRKLKENIKWLSVDKSMEVVRALRPTEWNWKKDHTHSFGFIAQDVQPIIPEMVSSVNDTLRLEYNQLHAFEIGAIQHIDSEVEQLKKKVARLENELNEYRSNAQWQ